MMDLVHLFTKRQRRPHIVDDMPLEQGVRRHFRRPPSQV
jgi:hypothetical protein